MSTNTTTGIRYTLSAQGSVALAQGGQDSRHRQIAGEGLSPQEIWGAIGRHNIRAGDLAQDGTLQAYLELAAPQERLLSLEEAGALMGAQIAAANVAAEAAARALIAQPLEDWMVSRAENRPPPGDRTLPYQDCTIWVGRRSVASYYDRGYSAEDLGLMGRIPADLSAALMERIQEARAKLAQRNQAETDRLNAMIPELQKIKRQKLAEAEEVQAQKYAALAAAAARRLAWLLREVPLAEQAHRDGLLSDAIVVEEVGGFLNRLLAVAINGIDHDAKWVRGGEDILLRDETIESADFSIELAIRASDIRQGLVRMLPAFELRMFDPGKITHNDETIGYLVEVELFHEETSMTVQGRISLG